MPDYLSLMRISIRQKHINRIILCESEETYLWITYLWILRWKQFRLLIWNIREIYSSCIRRSSMSTVVVR